MKSSILLTILLFLEYRALPSMTLLELFKLIFSIRSFSTVLLMLDKLLLDEMPLIIEILPENATEVSKNIPFEKVKLRLCMIWLSLMKFLLFTIPGFV